MNNNNIQTIVFCVDRNDLLEHSVVQSNGNYNDHDPIYFIINNLIIIFIIGNHFPAVCNILQHVELILDLFDI